MLNQRNAPQKLFQDAKNTEYTATTVATSNTVRLQPITTRKSRLQDIGNTGGRWAQAQRGEASHIAPHSSGRRSVSEVFSAGAIGQGRAKATQGIQITKIQPISGGSNYQHHFNQNKATVIPMSSIRLAQSTNKTVVTRGHPRDLGTLGQSASYAQKIQPEIRWPTSRPVAIVTPHAPLARAVRSRNGNDQMTGPGY